MKTYCGSMDRHTDSDGAYYWYRGFEVRLLAGSGWEVRESTARQTIVRHELMVIGYRATRNKAGNFIDRRIFNEQKKRAARKIEERNSRSAAHRARAERAIQILHAA